jgi:hypothetical protein
MKKRKIEDMPRNLQTRCAAFSRAKLNYYFLWSSTLWYSTKASKTQSDFVPCKLSRFQQISLSDLSKSIICGTLLGDGCLVLSKRYKNARLYIRHSNKQKEYFDWLVDNLQEIAPLGHQRCTKRSPSGTPSGYRREPHKSVQIQSVDKSSYTKETKLLFQSRALTSLTVLYNITYKYKRLYIQRHWLNRLSARSLAVWWCDDGSIIGSPSRRGVLCTDGFDEKSVRKLAQYLEKVWNVKAHAGAIRRNRKYGNYSQQEYYRLWFSTTELKKWLRIIMPHIPVASMVYKTIIVYKDSQFQQRWISEVKKALPQFSDVIEKVSLEKRKGFEKKSIKKGNAK